jgi:hypothetical protein
MIRQTVNRKEYLKEYNSHPEVKERMKAINLVRNQRACMLREKTPDEILREVGFYD